MLFLLNSNVFYLFFLPWCVWGLCFWAVLLKKKIMHARELLRRGQPPILHNELLRHFSSAASRRRSLPSGRQHVRHSGSLANIMTLSHHRSRTPLADKLGAVHAQSRKQSRSHAHTHTLSHTHPRHKQRPPMFGHRLPRGCRHDRSYQDAV